MKWPVAVLAASVLLVSGCAETAAPPSDSTDKVVTIAATVDQSGSGGFAGKQALAGITAAVDYVNDNSLAGDGVTLELMDPQDGASDSKQSVTLTQKAAESDADVMIFGNNSASAIALAPVAQAQKLPVVAFQSGAPGFLEAGNYLFRATSPQSEYHFIIADYFKSLGVKTVGIFESTDSATTIALAEEKWPELAEEYGFEIVATEKVSATGGDYATSAQKVLSQRPDAILNDTFGTPTIALSKEIIQSGYDGVVAGIPGSFGGEGLASLGADVYGWVYPIDFSIKSKYPSTVEFVEYFTDKNGFAPDFYGAEAWDTVILIAAGAANAETLDREGVHQGLLKAVEGTIEGAVGPLSFQGNDARVDAPNLLEKTADGDTPIDVKK